MPSISQNPPAVLPVAVTGPPAAAVDHDSLEGRTTRPEPLRLSAVERSMIRRDVAAAVAASRTGGHDA